MSRKVVVEVVQYDSVSVPIPDDFSDQIEDWTDTQKETIAELAHDKMYSNSGSGWEINEESRNGGFVEIVND